MAVRILLLLLALVPCKAYSQHLFCYALKGEALYWRADLSSQCIREKGGKQHALDPQWRPGFRVGLGYCPCVVPLALQAAWTHYEGKADKKVDLQTPYLGALTGEWRLKVDMLDVDLAKPLFFGCVGEVRPYVGFRALRLKHQSELDQLHDLFSMTYFRSRYEAGGVRVGCDATFFFARGLGVYLKGAYSFLYGAFHNKLDRTVTDFEGEIVDEWGRYRVFLARNMADFAIGLTWSPPRTRLCNPVLFRLGFEHCAFPFQWLTFEQEGLLSLYGATCSAEFFF